MPPQKGKKIALVAGVIITLAAAGVTGIYLPFYADVQKVPVNTPEQKSRAMWKNINESAKKS